MFGVNVSNLNFGIKGNSSNNQSTKTLWVLDTCLIVGLLPLIIILITASLSSNTYNIALKPECVPLDGTWSMLVRSRLVFVVGIGFRACLIEELPTGFTVALLHLWFCWFGLVKNEILQSQHLKDRERESHLCVNLHQEKSPQLLQSCVNFCLFLAHPTYWHERLTSENAKNSTGCWFGILQGSRNIRILK